ncbi:MAG TPA: NlpC/P60 family protein [Dermatophilaceae bacterium]|nr:NlpC/P60 family protein [Dermatophilaceae bacterium]HMT89911.1 NlpC/P60 family protein [Dermatophilaceae bacterium]
MSAHVGRHRASGYSPLAELAQIATDNVKPVARVSAAAVMSGGLIASMAMPASAVTIPEASPLPATGAADGAAAAEVGPSLSAPATAPANETFGALGFKTKKVTAASRSNDRAALTTTAASTTTSSTTTSSAAATPAAPVAAPKPAVNVPPSDGSIVGIARSLSGIRYVHGGSSPSAGFDCSGFTSYVYRQVGKSIPRTAEGQRAASTKVSNPQPGDLVFFGYPAYHVGIYASPGMLYDARRPGILSGLHTIWTTNKVSYGRF